MGEYIRGVNDEFGPCNVKVLRVSNLSRAKETAKIIHDNLGVEVELADPDPLLNEGRYVSFHFIILMLEFTLYYLDVDLCLFWASDMTV